TTTPGTNEGTVPGPTPDTTNGAEPGHGGQDQGTQPPAAGEQNKPSENQTNQNQTNQNQQQNQQSPDQNGQNSQNQPPKPEQPQNQPRENQQPENQPPQNQPSGNETGNNPPTEGLKIPPPGSNGQNLGFLQGQWTSKSGLFDRSTGKPLRQTYSFDQKGNGTVTIYRSDSSQCRGQAQAQLTGNGGLTIQDSGPIVCPDGTSYAPSVTKCEPGKSG